MSSRYAALSLVAVATMTTSVSAHARVWTWWVDGVDQNSGSGVASFIDSPPSNSPVRDLASPDVRCNVAGTKATTSFSAAAGSTISPEWYHDSRGDDIIASSHVGPIVTYIAPAESSDSWVKIAQQGYSGGSWAVTDLISNKGKHKIKIPSTLAPGDYLIRDEILALHESDALHSRDANRGIQLYPSCAKLTVTGDGTQKLPAGVAFPGTYTDDTPGILWSVYGSNDPSTYVIPGPAVWDGSASYDTAQAGSPSSTPKTKSAAASASTTAVAAFATAAAVTAASAASSVAEDANTTSAVAAPSSAAALEDEASSAAAPVVSSSRRVCPVKSKTSSAATVTRTSAAAVQSSKSATTTTSAAASEVTDYKCLDASQPHPDFIGCSVSLNTCTSGLNRKRMHKVIGGAGHEGRRA